MARDSDLGRNDQTYRGVTHLGNLLKVGDMALGKFVCFFCLHKFVCLVVCWVCLACWCQLAGFVVLFVCSAVVFLSMCSSESISDVKATT